MKHAIRKKHQAKINSLKLHCIIAHKKAHNIFMHLRKIGTNTCESRSGNVHDRMQRQQSITCSKLEMPYLCNLFAKPLNKTPKRLIMVQVKTIANVCLPCTYSGVTVGWAVWAKSRGAKCRGPRVPGKNLKKIIIIFPLW